MSKENLGLICLISARSILFAVNIRQQAEISTARRYIFPERQSLGKRIMLSPQNVETLILLIADESVENELLPTLLVAAGYLCQRVSRTQQACELIERHNSVDLMILATRHSLGQEVENLRRLSDAYLPVIVICDEIHDDLLDAYAEAGIDSYLTRPVNFHLLQTNIRSALRTRRLHLDQIEQRRQLLSYWQRMDLEQEVAANIYKSVLQSNFFHTEVVNAVMSSMALFNGDVLLVEKTPDNHLFLLLGDFTGHGLSASVGATPVADIFYGMVRKGFDLLDVLQEINLKLYKMLPANMFLALTATVLYPDSKTLSVVTCGLPEHFLVSDRDGSYISIASKNLPLGILDHIELVVQNFSVNQHQHLYLMTDGVIEAENAAGQPFGVSRIVEAVCQNDEPGIQRLQTLMAEHTQGFEQKDDLSIVELICDVDTVPWRSDTTVQDQRQIPAMRWKNQMEFDIQTLRQVNPVPVLVNALMEIQGLQRHRQAIFLIVSELYANALDHGVLKLDSSIKSTTDGFMQFYLLKQERLNSCNKGWIRFQLSHQPSKQGGRLSIQVVDSGDGFNWNSSRQQLSQNLGFCGRGVKLVESLCTRLTYHGKGNRVTAVFDWAE